MVNITAKEVRVWRKDIETHDGIKHRYSMSISSKKEGGGYDNIYLPVVFSKKSGAPSKISNGAICDFEGFPTVNAWTDKDGNAHKDLQIMVMKVRLHDTDDEADIDTDSFEQLETDIPF